MLPRKLCVFQSDTFPQLLALGKMAKVKKWKRKWKCQVHSKNQSPLEENAFLMDDARSGQAPFSHLEAQKPKDCCLHRVPQEDVQGQALELATLRDSQLT